MQALELLAPARDINIGIAAIDCGADAVYIAGPGFGARKDAGNSLKDIAELCSYAHRFGARIFMTVNTMVYDSELESVHSMMLEAVQAGVDAFIVQDLAIMGWDDIPVPVHASTQCAIRTPETARFYESMGCGRIVLERELSLNDIKAVHEAVDCELEFFVHGALCVCYSGQCYMSEHIAGRSANRGACIQACRSLYDLVDDKGWTLVHNKALLSLKDYNLSDRLEDLAEAGVCSFKVEGRLKNISYVRNVIRQYSQALDELVCKYPDKYCRASFGKVTGGFDPDSDKTFNRGYTTLYIDGKRGQWSSMDAPKSMGEFIGTVASIRKRDNFSIEVKMKLAKGVVLANGDGFSIPAKGIVAGFRGDICKGDTIICKSIPQIRRDARVYRNNNISFEKEMDRNICRREIPVEISVAISEKFQIDITAVSQDGRKIYSPFKADLDVAENRERAEALFREQLSKRSGVYSFSVSSFEVNTAGGILPLMSAATINSIRRLLAEDLDSVPVNAPDLLPGKRDDSVKIPSDKVTYKMNVANSQSRQILEARGAETIEPAYELAHQAGAELMRTKYCIRHELGMCPVHQGAAPSGKLHLENNGRVFPLEFDCRNCEMTVLASK